jgi:hypothetical protein
MIMKSNPILVVAAAALPFALPSAAIANDQPQYSARNDTSRPLTCGVRRAGSSAIDSFTIRAGEMWTGSFSGSKTRLLKCEGILSRWQELTPGQSYRLTAVEGDKIVVSLLSPH